MPEPKTFNCANGEIMDTKLKPYMGYSGVMSSTEGAILIFAHNIKEAKKEGWSALSFIHDCCDWEYINFRVNWIKNAPYLYKDGKQDLLITNKPHVIETPKACVDCNTWGMELNKLGYCENCAS